jgi:ABC-type sulfate transport system permease component
VLVPDPVITRRPPHIRGHTHRLLTLLVELPVQFPDLVTGDALGVAFGDVVQFDEPLR